MSHAYMSPKAFSALCICIKVIYSHEALDSANMCAKFWEKASHDLCNSNEGDFLLLIAHVQWTLGCETDQLRNQGLQMSIFVHA